MEQAQGYEYDCANVCKLDLFMRTTKEVVKYVGSTHKNGDDIC
jgi:hypothetical protein